MNNEKFKMLCLVCKNSQKKNDIFYYFCFETELFFIQKKIISLDFFILNIFGIDEYFSIGAYRPSDLPSNFLIKYSR